ncbi:hypothetical protein E0H26_13440 [Micromonospora zingiberis]|uniref:Uncharacterized protein n=1 Tax=Micromonospora zingiberis TaxID=2053011 RepID=A0A4R0GIE3_9ACTN|nr:hypothetical protein [Micromonospora zingiberis]TCB97264.1 hypothetical protein E0H26_13440 [Micromonospora zingiberis]
MKYVKVDWTGTGYLHDPTAYLDWLEQHPGALPPGATSFATDPGHYDIHSPRCPKDLRPSRMSATDQNDELTLELFFALLNDDTPDEGLRITYFDVVDFHISVTATRGRWVEPTIRRLGRFQLDELLPHEKGCSHEIKMIGGLITVISADLSAQWTADVPSSADRPADT